MSFFEDKPAEQAFLKAGFMGKMGSGKTNTATRLAIGLVRHMQMNGLPQAELPAMFLDTENGSDWVKPWFEEHTGCKMLTKKSRAFVDLLPAVREAEQSGSILIIDSISHFWTELLESFQKKLKVQKFAFHHWARIKPEWAKFADAFLNSQCHIIVCGRLGYDWDSEEDEQGNREFFRSDVKMKAEGEFGYEPNLLVLMERHTDISSLESVRTARVLKDRSMTIDGAQFEFRSEDEISAVFDAFRPHIEFLNLGGKQVAIDTARNSEDMFDDVGKPRWMVEKERKEIALDEVLEKIKEHHPGQSADEKKARSELLKTAFGSASWKRIETLPLNHIENGRDRIWIALTGQAYQFETPPDAGSEVRDAIIAQLKEGTQDALALAADLLFKYDGKDKDELQRQYESAITEFEDVD